MGEHVFSQAISIEILDGIACALLAAAASARARGFSAGISGCVVLGCLCGLFGPLLRELVLHGEKGASLVVCALPAEAFIGAIFAPLAMRVLNRHAQHLFFWLDATGMCLTTCMGTALGAPSLGAIGAIVLGMVSGLLPGFVRDVGMGDTAMLLDRPWYATCPLLGALAVMLIILLPAFFTMPTFFMHRLGEYAVLAGTMGGVFMMFIKRNNLQG